MAICAQYVAFFYFIADSLSRPLTAYYSGNIRVFFFWVSVVKIKTRYVRFPATLAFNSGLKNLPPFREFFPSPTGLIAIIFFVGDIVSILVLSVARVAVYAVPATIRID